MRCAYDLNVFISACAEGTTVWVTNQARETAAADFNLHTQAAILGFIASDGLEQPRHANTAPWLNNRDPTNIDVDSYDFYSGTTHGYIAFLYNPKTGKWVIKSFKLNDKLGQRFTQMGDALRKFKLLSGTKK